MAYGVSSHLLDIQRQQLPFGEMVFPVQGRYSETFNNETSDGLQVDLPKINAMADSHTDDGSVISRHYSATLVESAWRNRLNNSTMAFLLESTSIDASVLIVFSAVYLSSVSLMAVSRNHLVQS